jgi:hypothetical protein
MNPEGKLYKSVYNSLKQNYPGTVINHSLIYQVCDYMDQVEEERIEMANRAIELLKNLPSKEIRV